MGCAHGLCLRNGTGRSTRGQGWFACVEAGSARAHSPCTPRARPSCRRRVFPAHLFVNIRRQLVDGNELHLGLHLARVNVVGCRGRKRQGVATAASCWSRASHPVVPNTRARVAGCATCHGGAAAAQRAASPAALGRARTAGVQLRGRVKVQRVVVAHAAVPLVGRLHVAAPEDVHLAARGPAGRRAGWPLGVRALARPSHAGMAAQLFKGDKPAQHLAATPAYAMQPSHGRRAATHGRQAAAHGKQAGSSPPCPPPAGRARGQRPAAMPGAEGPGARQRPVGATRRPRHTPDSLAHSPLSGACQGSQTQSATPAAALQPCPPHLAPECGLNRRALLIHNLSAHHAAAREAAGRRERQHAWQGGVGRCVCTHAARGVRRQPATAGAWVGPAGPWLAHLRLGPLFTTLAFTAQLLL